MRIAGGTQTILLIQNLTTRQQRTISMPVDERRYEPPTSPVQFNVDGLFRTNSRLIIPPWQREYAWTGEYEVEDLLNDLSKFIDNQHRSNYLLGSIITCKSNNDRLVVDGQQRIVTLFILLCALHTNLKTCLTAEFQSADFPDAYKDTLDTLRRLVRHTTATSHFIPVEMEYGQGDIVLKSMIDDVTPNIDVQTKTQENIIEVYNHIKTYLSREYGDKSSLRNFAVGLMEGVYLSDIRVNDLRQALEVFIKLNNRGKDLEDSDLVKNFLFQQVYDDRFDRISDKWATMSRYLRSSHGIAKLKTAEFFLRNWALYLKGSRLGGEYPVWEFWEQHLSAEEVREQFLADLEKKAKVFSNLIDSKLPHNNAENIAMQGVKYVGGTQHLPLLLAGSHLADSSFDYLSQLVNSRTIVYNLSLERTQDFESLVPVWAKAISALPENASIGEIERAAFEANACLNNAQVTNLRAYLSTLSYMKQKKKLRLVLAIIAKKYQRSIAQDDLTLSQLLSGFQPSAGRGFDLDHIHPQSQIPENTEDEDNFSLYHGLGNLVLVNGRQRDYQDQMPISKMGLYKEGALLSKSLVEIDDSADDRTKDVWRRIQEHVPYSLPNWGPDIIKKRRDFLIEEFIISLPDVIMGRSN